MLIDSTENYDDDDDECDDLQDDDDDDDDDDHYDGISSIRNNARMYSSH